MDVVCCLWQSILQMGLSPKAKLNTKNRTKFWAHPASYPALSLRSSAISDGQNLSNIDS